MCQRINIVRYIIDEDRRYPDKARVRKISLQPTPEYQKEVRIQIGVVTYFRIWVEDFSIIYKLLFILLRTDAIFIQTIDYQQAKDRITQALVLVPILKSLNYTEGVGLIIVVVDSSRDSYREVLIQYNREEDSLRYPVRYDSGLQKLTEARYDTSERKCLGVLRVLQKFRPWLFSIFFRLEINTNTLVYQLNKIASDLPNSAITRQITQIHLFNFEVVYILGKKYSVVDTLLRRLAIVEDIQEIEEEGDVEDIIDRQFFKTFYVNAFYVLVFQAEHIDLDLDTILDRSPS